jgi:hypothetical protein
MNKDKETNNIKGAQLNFEQNPQNENQREEDRRHEPYDGFAYISTVGWIDRREKLRRKDDAFNF